MKSVSKKPPFTMTWVFAHAGLLDQREKAWRHVRMQAHTAMRGPAAQALTW